MSPSLPITITPKALEHVQHLLEQRGKPSLGLRIGIKSGGCSGLSYIVEYADEKGQFDEMVKLAGVTVIIDPKAIMYLIGTEMDYVDGDFKSGFVFNNPNEKNKCGCGKSFSV